MLLKRLTVLVIIPKLINRFKAIPPQCFSWNFDKMIQRYKATVIEKVCYQNMIDK